MNDSHELLEEPGPSQGFKQVLALVLLSGAIVILGAVFVIQRELTRQKEAMKWTMSEFGLGTPTVNRLNNAFNDSDNNLVADTPTQESKLIRPEKLTFSFIAGTELGRNGDNWSKLINELETKLDTEVVLRSFTNIDSQFMEMRTGTLHVTVINTGAVPRAVNTCGFVPVATFGDAEGRFGVTTQILVPAKSSAKSPSDLRGQRIMFTGLSSNSGFKAPIVILNEDFGMKPGIDYDYGFSTGHQESIALIASNSVKAASVASDMLDRELRKGNITKDDYRVIYESERFPPAAIGYLNNLHPEIAEKIREVIVGMDLRETPLEDALAAERLVEIDYKNDWALIRRIDNSLGVVHSLKKRAPVDASGQTEENESPDVSEFVSSDDESAENEDGDETHTALPTSDGDSTEPEAETEEADTVPVASGEPQ